MSDWPHTDDPHEAAWALLYRYLPQTPANSAVVDAVADILDLAPPPPWTRKDLVNQRLTEAVQATGW